MTLDEFFAELEQIPMVWILAGSRGDAIRNDNICPLEAVADRLDGKVGSRPCLTQLNRRLNFADQREFHSLWRACDNYIDPKPTDPPVRDYEIRQRLLKVCKCKDATAKPPSA